jgi:hypothetical protein
VLVQWLLASFCKEARAKIYDLMHEPAFGTALGWSSIPLKESVFESN